METSWRSRLPPAVLLEHLFDAADGSHEVGGLVGHKNGLLVVVLRHLGEHLDVLLGDEVAGGVGALAYGLGDLVDGNGLGFGLADACLGLTLGDEDGLLLVGFGPVDGRGLLAL